MAPERRWAWPRRPAGGPGRSVVLGAGRTSSPLVGLLLISDTPPGLASPPINSLHPRLWWPWIGFAGETAIVSGERGGDVPVLGCAVPAGLNEKAGRALTDFWRW